MIVIKTAAEIASMRRAGRVVAALLQDVGAKVRPGVTTLELDQLAGQVLERHGATSPFIGYQPAQARKPYPGFTCMSVNEQVVHGVPSTRRLVDGDILTIDCGALLDGWVADGAWTFAVGTINAEARELLQVTEQALNAAIAASRNGNQSGDVGAAMQKVVEAHGFNVIREHTSHGVGRELHEDPHIPNHGKAGTGLRLRTGMTIAMEPMVLAGHYATQLQDDEWTVAAKDGRLTAHFEHTIAIQDGDADILTRL